MATESDVSYDLFISYAHADNGDGWLTALVDAVVAEHAKFTSTPLRIFFDQTAIESMSDWEQRILKGLRESKIMLAALSPAYFRSAYCRKEWELYVEHELSQAMPGEAIAPIYIATHQEFEEHAGEALNEWMRNLKRRQYVDVRDWWSEGPHALKRKDVRDRLELMDQQIGKRLERLSRARASPTSVPDHNPNFVGRVEEIRRLRQILALGRVGAIATVHGIGGIGKSALAFEYAHAYADDYPDGRFLIACEGDTDLRMSLLKLVPQLGIELSDAEQRDPSAAVARIQRLLNGRTRTLLLFDNVDDPKLLASKQCGQYLPAGAKVHVLATTRMSPDRLPGTECVPLDSLSESDGIRLLEKHRPFCESDRDEEWKAALRIVRRLGGHSLAIEVVAVFLWQNPEVTYQGYLQRLKAEGLQAVESIADDESVQLSRHTETLVGVLLEPTMASLSREERSVLEAAAILPPDNVALPWLRRLVCAEFPELVKDPRPGHPDPWLRITRRLTGLRLLTPKEDGQTCRMHRVLQAIVLRRMGKRRPTRARRTKTYVQKRAKAIWEDWVHESARWEISPLVDYAYQRLHAQDPFGAWVANQLSGPLIKLGRYPEARNLLRRAVSLQKRDRDSNRSKLANSYSNLAMLEKELGDLESARKMLRRAIDIWQELNDEANAGKLPYGFSNLSAVERALGHYEAAKDLAAQAVELWEKQDEPNDKALTAGYANLAHVEVYFANYDSACRLHEKAIACIEKAYDANHPSLATSYSDLAVVKCKLGDFSVARDLCEKAIAIKTKIYPADHPSLAESYASQAAVENELAHFSNARQLWQQAIHVREKIFDPNHRLVAQSYLGLASAERNLANFFAARELFERALAIQQSVCDSAHPRIADTLAILASLDHDLANYEVSRELYNRALAISRNVFDESHPTIASRYSGIASLEKTLANYSVARELIEKSLAIRTKAFSPDHPSLASSYSSLGSLEQDLANFAAARQCHERSFAIRQQRYDADHPSIANAYSSLASLERELGNLPRSLELTLTARQIRERVFEPDHPALANSYSSMARFEWEKGNRTEAEELHRKALTIREQRYPSDHPVLANSYSAIGSLQRSLGNLSESYELFEKALEIRQNKFPEFHPLIASSYVGLASIERKFRNLDKARDLLSQAKSIDERVYGDEHTSVARDCVELAYVEAELGGQTEAADLMRTAWTIRKTRYGPRDSRTILCEQWLTRHNSSFQSGEES